MSIFSKFDINNDGSLDPEEFRRAIASITGQNAPEAIIRAVFSALDSDGDNSLDIAEILAIAEGGQAGVVTGEIGEITVQGHKTPEYNGSYLRGEDINGQPSYSKSSGHTLYFYNMAAGGANSWSLHKRLTDGSKDLYDGGWTRPPSSGGLPLGSRRWVGVGMLTITAVGDRSTPNAQEADDEETTDIRIEIEKSRYKSNESITVNFTGPTLGSDSWLGVVPADIEHGDSTVNRSNRVSYFDLEGQSIGTHIFENPGAGDWTIRMNEGSGDELAYVEFIVEIAEEEEITSIPVESLETNIETMSNDGLYSVDKMMTDLGPNFTNDLESLLSNPNQSIDEVRAIADEMAEEKIADLPFLFQSPARRVWSRCSNTGRGNRRCGSEYRC
ncbi:MAG: EF-hand domain-containing protein [Euryarchaeota archaeon]